MQPWMKWSALKVEIPFPLFRCSWQRTTGPTDTSFVNGQSSHNHEWRLPEESYVGIAIAFGKVNSTISSES